MAAQRHMFEFGTTSEQLAAIAVAAARRGEQPGRRCTGSLSIEDVVASRMIADPLHKFDYCVHLRRWRGGGDDDGGRARRDLPGSPVRVLSTASAQTHWNISAMHDFTTTAATTVGDLLFSWAGLERHVDVLQCYDSFTITVLFAPGGPRVLCQG